MRSVRALRNQAFACIELATRPISKSDLLLTGNYSIGHAPGEPGTKVQLASQQYFLEHFHLASRENANMKGYDQRSTKRAIIFISVSLFNDFVPPGCQQSIVLVVIFFYLKGVSIASCIRRF